jgi:hypothetical protein
MHAPCLHVLLEHSLHWKQGSEACCITCDYVSKTRVRVQGCFMFFTALRVVSDWCHMSMLSTAVHLMSNCFRPYLWEGLESYEHVQLLLTAETLRSLYSRDDHCILYGRVHREMNVALIRSQGHVYGSCSKLVARALGTS